MLLSELHKDLEFHLAMEDHMQLFLLQKKNTKDQFLEELLVFLKMLMKTLRLEWLYKQESNT
jgi:hypothetical protein